MTKDNASLIPDRAAPPLTRPWSPKEQVLDWLLDGLRTDDVNAGIDAYFEGVSREQVWSDVVEHLVATAESDKAAIVGWALEAYRDLYRRMVEAGELDGALKAVKELAALASRTSGVRNQQANDEERTAAEAAERRHGAAPARKKVVGPKSAGGG